MAPGLFRFFGTIKRSNVSSASTRSATPSSDIVVRTVQREPFQVNQPRQPLNVENRPHPLFNKVQQTWDYRYGDWSEVQRAQKYHAPTRSIPTNTRIIAYNRTDPFGKNNNHIWIVFKSQPLVELMRSEFRDVTDLLDSSPGLDARLVYNKRQSLAARASGNSSTEIDTQSNDNPEANPLDTDDLKALQLLLEFIDLEFINTTTQVADLQDEGMITWSLLWALCKRGTLMQRDSKEDSDNASAFELLSWVYKDKETNRGPAHRGHGAISDHTSNKQPAQFIVHGRSVIWTGEVFEDTKVELKIDHFLGGRLISDLPFQPLSESLRKKLTDRGKIYVKVGFDFAAFSPYHCTFTTPCLACRGTLSAIRIGSGHK
ncbi:hypothetical protein FRC08_002983 [Ceratobasidium sp. 394]|nr:hypothetical protein FRC08_002983 [Ceratobasidium sp. 394]